MDGINVSNAFKVNAPKPQDGRVGKFVGGRSVPYATKAEAFADTIASRRTEIGLQVAIGPSVDDFDYYEYRRALTYPTGGESGDGWDLVEINTIGSLPNNNFFNVVDYGAVGDGVTDDTTAFQDAIDAAFAANGGDVFLPRPAVKYIVAGALVTSLDGVNPNAQIVIPLNQWASGNVPTIRFIGEIPPSYATEGIAEVPRNQNGVIIESTIQGTGALPAVFGTSYYASPHHGNRNFVHVEMENLIVRTSTMSGATDIVGTMSAVNFEKLISFEADKLKVDISSSLGESEQPSGTVGIFFPNVNNKVQLSCGSIMAEGYDQGVIAGEHLNIQHLVTAGCNEGFVVPDGHHSISIQHMTAEVNRVQIALRGTSRLSIFNYETEHYEGSEWYAFQSDISNNSGSSAVRIFNSNVVKSGIGYLDEFITVGSPNYRIFNGAGENVEYGGSDVTPPALVGVAVEDATPDVVDFEFDENLDGGFVPLASDFAITGHTTTGTVTIDGNMVHVPVTAPFTLGEASRTASYTPGLTANQLQDPSGNTVAAFSGETIGNNVGTVLIFDDFNRADNASSLGNTVTPGTAWQVGSGTWGTISNKGYCASETSSGSTVIETAYHEVGSADMTVEADVTLTTNTGDGGVILRYVDNGNYMAVEASGGFYTLFKVVSGTLTILNSFASPGGAAANVGTTTMRVEVVGNDYEVFRNGDSQFTFTDPTHNTATKAGMFVASGSGYGGGVGFDDFTVN